MSYSIVQPPFNGRIDDMPFPELRKYFEWFMSVMPERLDQLKMAIHESPRYSSWYADFSPESLDALGDWFATQVETRPRTSEEVREIEVNLIFPMEVRTEDLTTRTLSLAMDIGMYLGHVMLKNLPGISWDQPLEIGAAYYGQPVLQGFGGVPFNPVDVMIVNAYSISEGQKTRVRDIYNIWAKSTDRVMP